MLSADAILAAGQFTPRLLIIDSVMPQISGQTSAQHIFGQTRSTVLLVSAGAADSRFEEILSDLRGEGCDCAALGLPLRKKNSLNLFGIESGPRGAVPHNRVPRLREAQGAVFQKPSSPESMIDFANMASVMSDAELQEGFVRVIMPDGKCFDILEELWTKARQIEPGCVIMSVKATGTRRN